MKTLRDLLLIIAAMTICVDLVAQCPMCKMAAESNMENGGTAGQGLNRGILYMLMMPYILIGTLAYIWYRNRKKNSDINSPIGA